MGDFLSGNPLLLLIAACEVGFWVLLGAGLVARYPLRARRVSTVVLAAVPLVDLTLVVASLLDVGHGRPPGFTHGLAAVYLGVTVAFGPSMIRWADVRFAHRFAGGPAPTKPPKYGPERIRHEWRAWGRAALAWVITLAVLGATALVAGTPLPGPAAWFTDPLWNWGARFGGVVVIWLLGWPVWVSVTGARAPAGSTARR